MQPLFAQRLRKALWLGLISSAITFLYVGHQVTTTWADKVKEDAGGPVAAFSLFLAEFTLAALIVFVCSATGFFLSRRYGLPGEGDLRQLPGQLRWFLLAGLIALPLGYIMHDRVFITGAIEKGWPAMIPSGIGWALALIAYGALFKEVVFRFGLLTMFAGLSRGRHPWWAVGGMAVFAAGLSMRELNFAGHVPDYDLVTLGTFSWALLLNAALGAVCIKKGLWSAMAMRACVDSRFVLYALLDHFSIISVAG